MTAVQFSNFSLNAQTFTRIAYAAWRESTAAHMDYMPLGIVGWILFSASKTVSWHFGKYRIYTCVAESLSYLVLSYLINQAANVLYGT